MKERPIIFSGEMIRAILSGQKTQTRRVIKPQPWIPGDMEKNPQTEDGFSLTVPWVINQRCPYGKPGDQLWVREAFCPDWTDHVIYKADDPTGRGARNAGYLKEPRYKPSIHMPRWASRIQLEITNIRVERVQDISCTDALYEGAPRISKLNPHVWLANTWDSINKKREFGWDTNPWVWVVEFRRVK